MKITPTILLASLLFSVLGAQIVTPVKATTTWVVPRDFLTIQEAIYGSSPGDTIIVNEGTYAEGQINVTKPLTLVASGSVRVDGLQKGHVFHVKANNVIIKGFTVKNSARGYGLSGIRLENVRNCTVFNNTLTDNTNGIGVGGSGYNVIKGNIASSNSIGIGLYSTRHNVVEENMVKNNRQYGIRLVYGSNENVVLGNVAIDNGALPGELGIGIYLDGGSSHNLIEGNVLRNNQWTGIIVWTGSNENAIRENDIFESYNGIYLARSSINNVIYRNTINASHWAGIKLRAESSNNMIIGNNITYTYTAPGAGILLDWAINNTIAGNLVSNNKWGVSIEPGFYGPFPSYDNIIYHNNFINNTRGQVYNFDSLTSINIWDSGYPYGGNYWSDYNGVDFYFGQYQNETGNDGIGDTPCTIDSNNADGYPLMSPWALFTTANVSVDPNTINLNAHTSGWVTTYIELPKGYGPANINITTVRINGTVPAVTDPKYGFVTNSNDYLVDRDGDGVLDRVVKFNSSEVIPYILNSVGYAASKSVQATLTITGKLYIGTAFEGSVSVKIIKKGKA